MTIERRLWVPCIAAVLLAIPMLSFVSALVVFPLLFYALLAIIANFLPVAILGAHLIGWQKKQSLIELWQTCAIMWVGCAYGLARWGTVASSMGGKDTPYFRMLFAPIRYLLGYPIT